MRKCFILFLILFLQFNFDFACAETKTRKATDLILFPNAKEIISNITYFNSIEKYSRMYNSNKVFDTERTSNGFSYMIEYAFNDYLGLGITTNQVLLKKTTISYPSDSGGRQDQYESSGFEDPDFSLSLRVSDTATNDFDMDFTFLASPKLQDAKNATTTTKGNVGKGGSNFGLIIESGVRKPVFSWAFGLMLKLNGEAETQDAASKDSAKITSYGSIGSSLDFQWNVSPIFSFEFNVGGNVTGQYRVTYSTGNKLVYGNTATYFVGGVASATLPKNIYLTIDLIGYKGTDQTVTENQLDIYENRKFYAGVIRVGLSKSF